MSEYTERYVRLGNETSWGTYATPDSFDVINYCLGFDATTTEERIEEDIVAASRQAISRVWTQRSVVGAFESNVFSSRLMYYALGRVVEDTTTPYTVSLSGTLTLPSFSVERGLRGYGNTIYTGYMGCKVDRYELLIEAEEDVVETVDWVGSDNTFPTYAAWSTVSPSTTFPLGAYAYHESCLIWGTSTINLYRVRLEINNNLVPRYAGSCASGLPIAFEIREGRQAISGEFTVAESINVYAETATRGRQEGTIVVRLANAHRGTIQLNINRVALDEFVDSLRGRDVYEVPFPFTARTSTPSAYDAITIVHESTIAGTIHDMAL